MIDPTVGRIVWYRDKLVANVHPSETPEQAAIISAVHSSRLVNIHVFTLSGGIVGLQNVTLVQEGDVAPADRGYAEWMPYQKGQAAKTEALEQKLAGAPA